MRQVEGKKKEFTKQEKKYIQSSPCPSSPSMKLTRIAIPARFFSDSLKAIRLALKIEDEGTLVYAMNVTTASKIESKEAMAKLAKNIIFNRRSILCMIGKENNNDEQLADAADISCRIVLWHADAMTRTVWLADLEEWTAAMPQKTFMLVELEEYQRLLRQKRLQHQLHQMQDNDFECFDLADTPPTKRARIGDLVAGVPNAPTIEKEAMAIVINREEVEEKEVPIVIATPLYIPHSKTLPRGDDVSMKRCKTILRSYYLILSDKPPVMYPTGESFWEFSDITPPVQPHEDMFSLLYYMATISRDKLKVKHVCGMIMNFYKRALDVDPTLLPRIRATHLHYAGCAIRDTFINTLNAQLQIICGNFKKNYDNLPCHVCESIFYTVDELEKVNNNNDGSNKDE